MKSFTIKDFIEYNNPCKMCGKNVFLQLSDRYTNRFFKLESSGTTLTFLLQNKYNGNISLIFDAKTNKYKCPVDLEEYNFQFFLSCHDCLYVKTETLKFNKDHVIPLKIESEQLVIITDSSQIIMWTANNKTLLDVHSSNSQEVTRIELPIQPISKWKTKEKLLSLITTYLAFS